MNDVGLQSQVSRRHFPITVKMFHRMGLDGYFAPEDRVELIDGEIFEMSPIGSLHARCVNWLNQTLNRLADNSFIVSVQNPVVLTDYSEPQPDLSVVRYREDFYKFETPGAKDSLIVIEVADSSVEFDRNTKIAKYAEAGIPEAWLIDLVAERVEIHSQPTSNGYGLVDMCHRGENAASQTIPSIDLSVDDILG